MQIHIKKTISQLQYYKMTSNDYFIWKDCYLNWVLGRGGVGRMEKRGVVWEDGEERGGVRGWRREGWSWEDGEERGGVGKMEKRGVV